MLQYMRRVVIDILIKLLLENLEDTPKEVLSKEAEDMLLVQMWESPAFRKRVANRDAQLIFTMAGGEGLGPEPRDEYVKHAGQRIENLLWARDAKAAYMRNQKRIEKEKTAKEDGLA